MISLLPRIRPRSSPWIPAPVEYGSPEELAERRLLELAEEVDFLGYRLSAAERNGRVLLQAFLRLEERTSISDDRIEALLARIEELEAIVGKHE